MHQAQEMANGDGEILPSHELLSIQRDRSCTPFSLHPFNLNLKRRCISISPVEGEEDPGLHGVHEKVPAEKVPGQESITCLFVNASR